MGRQKRWREESRHFCGILRVPKVVIAWVVVEISSHYFSNIPNGVLLEKPLTTKVQLLAMWLSFLSQEPFLQVTGAFKPVASGRWDSSAFPGKAAHLGEGKP
eukprot:TRINITY_DN41661_c0_g1_i4.p1 TRINITY_DN41661_c0_g1~~TRINITY_DN41661_c0_g1_i4.p1  ORF type:complete len:102 (+),score=9.99 TRINITY_DN41661_c0_g1_i4:454-759(+)